MSKIQDVLNQKIIMDTGTETIKLGYAGESAPREIVPTLYGHSRYPMLEIAIDKCDYKVGKAAYQKRGLLNIISPITNRKITDFDIIEKIWHHCFYDVMKIDPCQNNFLITESCEYTQECREKIGELFFEFFGAQSIFLGNQGMLGLFSSGNTKGVVLDTGEGGSHVIPIYEGYISPNSV